MTHSELCQSTLVAISNWKATALSLSFVIVPVQGLLAACIMCPGVSAFGETESLARDQQLPIPDC